MVPVRQQEEFVYEAGLEYVKVEVQEDRVLDLWTEQVEVSGV